MDIFAQAAVYTQIVFDNFGELGVIAYVALFVIAFLDSLIVTGTFTNGVAFLVLAGALAGDEMIATALFTLMAFMGALLGSMVGYYLGRHSRAAIKGDETSLRAQRTKRSRELIEKYGVFALIFGRFLGPISSVVSFVAGMIEMPVRKFFGAAIIASASYAGVYIYFGSFIVQLF